MNRLILSDSWKINFMFSKDTGLCQNHVLFQGPHPWPKVTNVVNVQGKSIHSLAHLLRLLVRFPVGASPTDGCWSAQSFRDVTTWLTTSELVPPLHWWEFRKLAGADLWSLTCWPCKLIPLVLTPPHWWKTYWPDIYITAAARTFSFGTPGCHCRRFCCGHAGCDVREEHAARHHCPHPQPRVTGPNPCNGLVSSGAGPIRGPRQEHAYLVATCD